MQTSTTDENNSSLDRLWRNTYVSECVNYLVISCVVIKLSSMTTKLGESLIMDCGVIVIQAKYCTSA
jgi:hypothetical protein